MASKMKMFGSTEAESAACCRVYDSLGCHRVNDEAQDLVWLVTIKNEHPESQTQRIKRKNHAYIFYSFVGQKFTKNFG
jgi:hypothetical protein